jgi:hypothetical protein
MYSKQEALSLITNLTERFADQIDSYKKSDYNETLTRRDFIDPMFKALGWDMDNSQGYAEAYREVIHEDRLTVAGATKAPDYSFKLPGGKRLFFLEAKKPSIQVKNDVLPAFQLRRYGWSAKMPISLITDFEEFAVYDCSKKPSPSDKASAGRVKYFTYKDYINNFDFLWETFSKERVLKGGYDRFIASDSIQKGTTTVDKEFLKSLDGWRTRLAIVISKRNPDLNEDELNFVVQQLIDRIIFLRIAEDRKVEEYESLKTAVKAGESYKNLFGLFKVADSKYNSGLFDFRKDKISEALNIDNKTIKGIIEELYFPAPYEFSVLPVEILGSVYEQFLGKQITLDEHHKAHIEEKPEVRKAGGVYYTPQYIVDYIVDQTVGKLVGNRSPKEVAKLKVVDPACGSGSFLLGAYQFLLNWHQTHYMPEFERLTQLASSTEFTLKQRHDAVRERSKLPLTPDGNLTTKIKKEILLNNIYGVDLDVNAVEVTKLSLLLKCMEGETQSSMTATLSFGERVLPTLDHNIRSGNSLVDVDFYDGEFGFEGKPKVKPFNWEHAFPSVFKQGGFDAVIGNPPYIRQELLGIQKSYFAKKYNVYDAMADLYVYFIEKGHSLLNKSGLFGIIVANKWMKASYGEPLRKWLKTQPLKLIVDFGDLQVFHNATTYPCIIISGKGKLPDNIDIANLKTLQFENLEKYINQEIINIPVDQLKMNGWNLVSKVDEKLISKLTACGKTLGEYIGGEIYYGVKTGFNDAFVIDSETRDQLITDDPRSAELIKPYLGGRDIKRYNYPQAIKFLIFTRRGIDISLYPAIKKHLLKFKTRLEPKPRNYSGPEWKGRKAGSYAWFELQDAVDYFEKFEKPKIILPDIALRMQATYDINNNYLVNTAYIIPVDDKALLGILNSKVITYYYSKVSSSIRGGYLRFIRQYLEQIPIVYDEAIHQQIRLQVEQILTLKKKVHSARLDSEVQHIESHIGRLDVQIDSLVFKLYNLQPNEIKIINGEVPIVNCL